MGTQKSNNHGWDKPVFPSSTVDTELDNLFDQIDTDVFMRGPEADRPAAGTFGRVYVTTDTRLHFYDNGTSWDDITPSRDWSVSNSGGKVLSKPDDIDFGTALSVTDDGDGTLTVDVSGVTEAELAFDTANQAELDAHTTDTANPHSVTASQVGAIPDTSGSVTETNLSFNPATDTELNSHTGDTSNPHSVTASQVGAVDLNGDVMSGKLTINKPADYHGLVINSQYNSPDEPASILLQGDADGTDDIGIEIRGDGDGSGGIDDPGDGANWGSDSSSTDTKFVAFMDGTTVLGKGGVGDNYSTPNGALLEVNGGIHANSLTGVDKIFLAEGSNTDINQSSWVNVSWSSTKFNDSAYSFNGTTATIQESGEYEIIAEMDFSSSGASRQNPNLGLQQNGNWVGVIGRSGYMRDAESHNHSSIHARAVVSASSGDTIHAEAYGEADTGGSITPDRAQFYIKKLHR